MESIDGQMIVDGRDLHTLFGLDLSKWESLIGLHIDHGTFGTGRVAYIEETGQSHLKIGVQFAGKLRNLSSAFLGKGTVLIPRPEDVLAPQIQSRVTTRKQLRQFWEREELDREQAAEEIRRLADIQRMAAAELAQAREKERQEEAVRRAKDERERKHRLEEQRKDRQRREEE